METQHNHNWVKKCGWWEGDLGIGVWCKMKDKRGGGGVNVKCVREEEKEKGV